MESLYQFDLQYLESDKFIIVGVDEAGRGPLAGPVVASAVILDYRQRIPLLNDSKKIAPRQREIVYKEIINKSLHYSYSIVDHQTIDEINIFNASKLAMIQAIEQLKIKPDLILSDAMRLENMSCPVIPIIKGDAKSACIAAASVIAKVTRDELMIEYHKEYPEYLFGKHKGYPTQQHMSILKEFGPCSIHRKSFQPVKNYFQN